jgi:hypothetical protein
MRYPYPGEIIDPAVTGERIGVAIEDSQPAGTVVLADGSVVEVHKVRVLLDNPLPRPDHIAGSNHA